MVGCIAWGHCEVYYIMDSDQFKGANMEATVISRTLDIVNERLQVQGAAMPRSLVVAADNTVKEAKNQTFLSFLGFEKASEKFDSVEAEYMKSGHTHNEQDQRFSVVAGVVSSAPVLENKEEFRDYMQAHIPPVKGREVIVEILPVVWDFEQWLDEPLNVHIKGLGATHLEPEATHVWRIISRSLLPSAGFTDESIVCFHEGWKHIEPNPADAILLLKAAMHKTSFTQQPILLCPAVVANAIDPGKLKPAALTPLGQAVINQFRRTEETVAKPPWNLLKAQAYLQSLCDNNINGFIPEVEPPSFVLSYKMKPIASAPALPLHLYQDPNKKLEI